MNRHASTLRFCSHKAVQFVMTIVSNLRPMFVLGKRMKKVVKRNKERERLNKGEKAHKQLKVEGVNTNVLLRCICRRNDREMKCK